MFKDNLIQLRKLHKMTQEELAEKLGCSRQTLSKWETGASVPDIGQSKQIADLFDVTLDDLVCHDPEKSPFPVPPRGKHVFGCVKAGDKGQIILPARARKVFDIHPGDSLVILGDESQGIGILKEEAFLHMLARLRGDAD